MRWDDLRLDDEQVAAATGGPVPLLPRGAVSRTFDTPEFQGITFHEVTARSALNKVPDASRMPFRWTINPYRGCTMACTYCLGEDTLVLMADGRSRPISEVIAGDLVYGTTRVGGQLRYVETEVLNSWRSVRRAVRLTLDNGTSIVASPDHRFLSNRGWKHVLSGSCWSAAQRPRLTTQNSLRGFGAAFEGPKHDEQYRRGYLTGMIRGDANLKHYWYTRPGRANGDVYRFRLALTDDEPLDRSQDFLQTFGVATTSFSFLPATPDHRAMRAIRTSRRADFETIRRLVSWPIPTERDDQWRLGYLAGITDAEGSHSMGILRIANTDREIVEHLCECLDRFGFAYTIEDYRRANGIRVVRLTGGATERLRFFALADLATTRKRSFLGMAVKAKTRIRSIEDLGIDVPMYDLTTGTGDFIANGVVSHNCFARKTHEYLDLDSGHDFDSQIVVKTNIGEVLRRELARPSWQLEHVAMGTNVDCYQRVEGRYQLMRDIIPALTAVANPFSILTKGALILRDLDLLAAAAQVTDVSAALSIGSVDRELRGKVEPGAPPPARRLDVVRQLNDAGIRCGVLMAPILPFLSDSDEQLDATVEAIAAAGAAYVSPIVLHLRPGAREWWQAWLRREHPDLLPRYAELYGERAYAPKAYQRDVSERVHALASRHKVGRRRTLRGGDHLRSPAPKSRAAPADTTPKLRPEQLSML
jgi:DNA repair photolyase